MKGALPRKNKEKCRVLVAPLDWGLGHATRCIPIIRALEKAGAEPWLAGEGAQETLLRAEFPHLAFLPLKGYGVRYARSARGMMGKVLSQFPAIRRAIRAENKWLNKAIKEYEFDAVISDNRYGLYHESIPCIIITHQLAIKSGLGNWTDGILQKWNYSYLKKFKACWIPDFEENGGLAGELSHPQIKPPIPLKYIGSLSRFQKLDLPIKKNKLLVILSGPEPQRTILEEIIFRDIAHYPGEATVVRGLPTHRTHVPSTGMIQIYNHLDADTLNREMNDAEFVIARSGYSTIMDAFRLGKKCIFIPTPGQTEQEYLGQYLHKKNQALCQEQKFFELEPIVQKARKFCFENLAGENTELGNIISEWVEGLK